MMPLQRTDTDSEPAFHWHKWLSLVVMLALATSLVARYAYVSSLATVSTVEVVGSRDNRHHCQRLDSNALRWVAAVENATVFVSAVTTHPPAPTQFLVAIHIDESLYNRPPPSYWTSVGNAFEWT